MHLHLQNQRKEERNEILRGKKANEMYESRDFLEKHEYPESTVNDVEAEEDGRRGRTRRTRKRTPFVSPRLWELFKWITAATPVAKFSGGFADPLLKFRWIIRRGGGERCTRLRKDEAEKTRYLLYLTEDGVFLKKANNEGWWPQPPSLQPPSTRPPVFKKMFNAAESKTW